MRDAEEALLKLCQHTLESTFVNYSGGIVAAAEACNHTRACTSSNTHEIQPAPASASQLAASVDSTSTNAHASPIAALSTALCPCSCGCSCVSAHVGKNGLPDSASSWWGAFLATGHFEHLGSILRAANFIARTMQGGTSCLVHCSDGWDRTSQLTALAQLCLDPFYRTMHGFFVLICKEWLSFGHKFTERIGHGGIGGRENSPVFTQWLDCVYQMLHQFPSKFEFGPSLLLALRHSLHSGKYGTWFGNCEAERGEVFEEEVGLGPGMGMGLGMAASTNPTAHAWRLSQRTPSVFSQLWRHRHAFLNHAAAGAGGYEFASSSASSPLGSADPSCSSNSNSNSNSSFQDLQSESARNNPLQVDLHKLVFWSDYYFPNAVAAPIVSHAQRIEAEAAAARRVIAAAAAATAATTAAASPLTAASTAPAAGAVPSAVSPAAELSSLLEKSQGALLSARASASAAQAQQAALYEARLAQQSLQLEKALAALAALRTQQQQQEQQQQQKAPQPTKTMVESTSAASGGRGAAAGAGAGAGAAVAAGASSDGHLALSESTMSDTDRDALEEAEFDLHLGARPRCRNLHSIPKPESLLLVASQQKSKQQLSALAPVASTASSSGTSLSPTTGGRALSPAPYPSLSATAPAASAAILRPRGKAGPSLPTKRRAGPNNLEASSEDGPGAAALAALTASAPASTRALALAPALALASRPPPTLAPRSVVAPFSSEGGTITGSESDDEATAEDEDDEESGTPHRSGHVHVHVIGHPQLVQLPLPAASSAASPKPAPPASAEWHPDSSVSACNLCREQFTFLKRKHHCRSHRNNTQPLQTTLPSQSFLVLMRCCFCLFTLRVSRICGRIFCSSCCTALCMDSKLTAAGAPMEDEPEVEDWTTNKPRRKNRTRICLACKKENRLHVGGQGTPAAKQA